MVLYRCRKCARTFFAKKESNVTHKNCGGEGVEKESMYSQVFIFWSK